MTSVFLQHFSMTHHATSAVLSVLWDLKECNYEIRRMILFADCEFSNLTAVSI